MKRNGYEELANAIILRAVEDYRGTRYEPTLHEIEQFFLSPWFMVLTKIDGKALLDKLRKEKKR